MKSVKIFIVFERQDIEVIKNLVASDDFILGDLDLNKIDELDSILIGRQISPNLSREELSAASEVVRNFFAKQIVIIDEDLLGFVNNFFEASLVPLLSYVFALDKLIKSIEASGVSVSLVFPHEIKLAKTSSFFLAEHEAQSVFLYDRASVFQPYLLDNFSSRLEVLYAKSTHRSFQTLSNVRQFIRLWGVFCIRLGFSIFRAILVPHSPAKPDNSFNAVAITRTPNKSEFIESLFAGCDDVVGVCVGENFGRISRNYKFCQKTLALNYSSILQMQPPGIFFILKEYFKSAIKISSQRKIFLSINHNDIDITQSLKEMIALIPDLKIYMHSLEKTISGLNNLSLMISTELKSPYAYGDSKVSIHKKLKCIHLQDCDYLPSPIPIPIFGNAFVIRDPDGLGLYKSAWAMYGAEKVYKTRQRLDLNLSNLKNSGKLVWCFFTSAVKKNDLLVLDRLEKINKSYGVKFIVKLHPRDSILKYFKYWRKFKFYRDGDTPKKSLFGLFDVALTFSSAVINDLEASKIPYMLLNIDPISHFNNPAHYKISDQQEISSFNQFIDKFMWAHQNFSEFKSIFNFEKDLKKTISSSELLFKDLKKIVNI